MTSAIIALSAVTGQRDEPGRKGTLIVTTLFLNWMVLDHFIKTMASVDEKMWIHLLYQKLENYQNHCPAATGQPYLVHRIHCKNYYWNWP